MATGFALGVRVAASGPDRLALARAQALPVARLPWPVAVPTPPGPFCKDLQESANQGKVRTGALPKGTGVGEVVCLAPKEPPMSATYESFSLADMQAVLSPERGWQPAPADPSYPVHEHVLDWSIPDGPAAGLSIRVYTSIDLASGVTREVGSDAIRVCVPKKLKSERVNRTAGWQQRLVETIRAMLALIQAREGERKAKMAAAVEAVQAAAPKAAKVNLSAIGGLLGKATVSGLKTPKITLTDGPRTVRFKLAGPQSKYHGQVIVDDGGAFGVGTYFGRITEGGDLVSSQKLTPEVLSLVVRFAEEPLAVAVELGKKSGNCQFCNKELTTEESLAAGYGPVCAKHYGLPWGGKKEVA